MPESATIMSISHRGARRLLLTAGLAIALLGLLLILRLDLARQREAFEVDARIAHRLLSQQLVQHDAILASLALLQPAGPEQRLPTLYPQVLQLLRSDAAWPRPAWRAADAASEQARQAVLVELDPAGGRYLLLRHGRPASYAVWIDIERMMPWSEWPMARDGPVRLLLRHDGRELLLQPGHAGRPLFELRKTLASPSQRFELLAQRPLSWGELPWAQLGLWLAAWLAALVMLRAWLGQRDARRRAEQRLRLDQVGRLNALGELAAGMAHELNQPLTAMLASSQAARRMLAEQQSGAALGALDQAVQQAKRASEVLARLRRAVQRPELATEPRPTDLAAAARQVLELLRPEAERLGVQPQLEGPSPTVLADPVALEQILHNLVLNALQALEQVPRAERQLRLFLEDAAPVRLLVQDSGPGLSDEALRHAFEPFFSTRKDGLGLGLSLVESLALAMGGSLSCANRHPRGAEFSLLLPAAR